MNILSLAEWDWAGVGYQLSQAINTYTEHQCKAVRWRKTSRAKFPHGIIAPSDVEFLKLYEWCDVIHIHDKYSHLPRKCTICKPTVVTYHGSSYRRGFKTYNDEAKRNKWFQTVATMDLLFLGNNRWMPDARVLPSIECDKHKEFTVCQAPTSKRKRKDIVREACKIAKIRFELIEDEIWSKCIERKARCHVLIDQFKIAYGCNAIEAWMLGLPVIANSLEHPLLLKMIESKNSGTLPFLCVDEDARKLARALVRLRDDTKLYSSYVNKGKVYVGKFHSPESVARKAITFYEMAIDKMNYAPVKKVRKEIGGSFLGPGDEFLVYLGKNVATETIRGPITNKEYKYSANDRLLVVDKKDVNEMLKMNLVGRRKRGRKTLRPRKMFRRYKQNG